MPCRIAAFSIALLVSANGAVPAGRRVDRGGARLVMALGSCAGAAVTPLSIGLAYLAWGGYRPILVALAILSARAMMPAGRAPRVTVSAPSPSEK